MHSHKWAPALLLMALLAMQSTASKAQQSTAAIEQQPTAPGAQRVAVNGGVVEMTVAPLKNGKRPQDVDCVVKIRLVSGRAMYRSTLGRTHELRTPNEVLCEKPNGEFDISSSTESILGFEVAEVTPPPPVIVPPPSGGVTPPPILPPCPPSISPPTPGCR